MLAKPFEGLLVILYSYTPLVKSSLVFKVSATDQLTFDMQNVRSERKTVIKVRRSVNLGLEVVQVTTGGLKSDRSDISCS